MWLTRIGSVLRALGITYLFLPTKVFSNSQTIALMSSCVSMTIIFTRTSFLCRGWWYWRAYTPWDVFQPVGRQYGEDRAPFEDVGERVATPSPKFYQKAGFRMVFLNRGHLPRLRSQCRRSRRLGGRRAEPLQLHRAETAPHRPPDSSPTPSPDFRPYLLCYCASHVLNFDLSLRPSLQKCGGFLDGQPIKLDRTPLATAIIIPADHMQHHTPLIRPCPLYFGLCEVFCASCSSVRLSEDNASSVINEKQDSSEL